MCASHWKARTARNAARAHAPAVQTARIVRAWAALEVPRIARGRWRGPDIILVTKKVCHWMNEGWHVAQLHAGAHNAGEPLLVMSCAQKAKQKAVAMLGEVPPPVVYILAVGAQTA